MPRKHSKKSLWQPEIQNEFGATNSRPNMPPMPNIENQMYGARPQGYVPNNPYMQPPVGRPPVGQPPVEQPPQYGYNPYQGVQPPRPPMPQQRPPIRPQRVNVVPQMVDNYDPRNVEYARTIVQPIALVPYNTEDQNMQQFDGGFNDYDDSGYDDSDYDVEYPSKRFNALKLFTFIFGLLTIAVLVLGKFLNMDAIKPYLLLSGTKSGYEIIMGITSVMSSNAEFMDKLPTILLTVGSALLIILVLISLFSMRKRTGGFSKFIALLMMLCMVGFVVLIFIDKSVETGGYIVAGLSLLTAISTFAGRK